MSEQEKIIEQLGNAFENFKKENDDRLKAVEKGASTADFDQKLEKLNETISDLESKQAELEAKGARPSAPSAEEAQSEYKEAYARFITKGDDAGLATLAKSLNITVDADGGHTVPEDLDRAIHDLVIDLSPMRSICNVVTTGTSDYKKLVNLRGTASGWVGEQAARPETASPKFAEIAPPIGEIYANAWATQTMLDDAFFDVDAFLSGEVATEFAKKEGQAFISGDGVNKPTGFLTETVSADVDGVRAFGELQAINTGAAGAFVASPDSADVFINTAYSLKQGHRNGAQWVLNKNTLAEVRKMKDSDGAYIWQPSLTMGQPSTILGYGVTEMEDMPDVAADSLSIAFGNFRAGYTIVDRMGTRFLRDPYSEKPFIQFYSTKRVGGKVIDSEAIKLIKFAV